MNSHIGCICLVFLHCAFSNVSSNFLPENRQSCIGCICWTFLHCAFSNVPSNCLHQRMHSHIGCICLTFLHCVFSNESSNAMPAMMLSQTGCIFLLFFSVGFQMNYQMACLRGCIVTLVAFIWPFSTVSFHCLLYTSPSPRDLSTSRMPSSA